MKQNMVLEKTGAGWKDQLEEAADLDGARSGEHELKAQL